MYRIKSLKLNTDPNKVIIFIIAFVLSFVYYVVNIYFEGRVLEFVAENLIIQTTLIFLAISSLVNIFYPFTIRKELSEKDAKSIAEEYIRLERKHQEFIKYKESKFKRRGGDSKGFKRRA